MYHDVNGHVHTHTHIKMKMYFLKQRDYRKHYRVFVSRKNVWRDDMYKRAL